MSELKYLKRLIEVALPLKEVSEQSSKEKRQISALHRWWARRPPSACRALVFASLIPDPDDPECPEHFRQLVRAELGDNQFKPKDGNGSTIEDTPRNRCLEFIKHLVRWENSNEPTYIEPARKLIKEAHKIFHPDSDSDVPKVLDPFAGGGIIPLEALRLGCEAHAVELNPVAHLIELCTLVYPQKFGKPLSKDKPIPDYIKRLITHNRAQGKDKSHATLFEKSDEAGQTDSKALIPDVAISEAEYRKNPLAVDVKYWGHWILAHARKELEQFYPPDEDDSIPVAYLWARTVKCPNPACAATIPLIKQLWLCRKTNRKVAMRMMPHHQTKKCDFDVTEERDIDFDPDKGTMQRGQAACPFCTALCDSKYLQAEGNEGRIGSQLLVVVSVSPSNRGKKYRNATIRDYTVYEGAKATLDKRLKLWGSNILPTEPLQAWSGVFNAPLFGMNNWSKLFNHRQQLALCALTYSVTEAVSLARIEHSAEYTQAFCTYVAFLVDKHADYNCTLASWHPSNQQIKNVFNRQALPMVWDFCEANPISGSVGSVASALDDICRFPILRSPICLSRPSQVRQGSVLRLPEPSNSIEAVVTDPPYYDAVPYSDLSDFFYVWLKRTLGSLYESLFRSSLSPKREEVVSHLGKNYPGTLKTSEDYERGMAQAFSEVLRVLRDNGTGVVMFAHKTTTAWESIIKAMVQSKLIVTSSWPLSTEQSSRMRARASAALATSVTIVCKKKPTNAGEGFWDDVRRELREVANERLDFFWNQGIRGADFFISAIGPALSVFGKYERVVRLSGEPVSVRQFLEEVRSIVTEYALDKIIKQRGRGQIDAETRFYVVWKWSYGDAKVRADEAFTMAKALGLDTEIMWDRTGTLEKSGQNVEAMSIAKRMKIGNLGEPDTDGSPGSIVDVLHRMCGYRDKGDTIALTEYLARSGHGRNETLWLVAQAISEILPDGDKEKQLLQGLLNQRNGIMEAARDKKLF